MTSSIIVELNVFGFHYPLDFPSNKEILNVIKTKCQCRCFVSIYVDSPVLLVTFSYAGSFYMFFLGVVMAHAEKAGDK